MYLRVFCWCLDLVYNRRIVRHSLFVNARSLATSAVDDSKEDEVAGEFVNSYHELRKRIREYAGAGNFVQALNTLHYMSQTIPGTGSAYDINALMYWCSRSSSLRNFNALVKLYHRMKISGPKPNPLTFKTLLNGMVKLGELGEAVYLVNDMCEFGYTPSFSLLNKILKKCILLRRAEDSIFIQHLMLRFSYIPVEWTHVSLICLLCKQGMVHQAFAIFSYLFNKGILYQGYTFGPILWALCKSGKSNCALQLLFWMLKSGLCADDCSYTALIYGFCREGRLEHAFWCLEEMRRVGRSPNLITYTVLIKHFCDCSNADAALGVLDVMDKEGCGPDVLAYNIVLRELCHLNRFSDVMNLFKIMISKGLSPDSFTISAFAGGLLKANKVGIAYQLMLDILSTPRNIDVAVYNIYFRCLCLLKRSREALHVLNKVEEVGVTPNIVSYNTIVDGFCGERKLYNALKLLDLFKWDVIKPNLRTYNTILFAACKLQNRDVVDKILFRMEKEGIHLDEIGFSSLIYFVSSTGEFATSFTLFDTMMKQWNRPSVAIISDILEKLCRYKLVDAAARFSDHYSSFLDTRSYNILIEAAVGKHDYSYAHRLINEMLGRKMKPDSFTYSALIYVLCREGKISAAFRMRKRMMDEGIISSSTVVYNTLMKTMVQNGKLLYVLSLLQDMLMEGCMIDEATWEIINELQSKRWLKIFPDLKQLFEHSYSVMRSKDQHSKLARKLIVKRIGS